ncbi:hypothetical protein NDA16_000086 [Ustilago loliicola]|nr:hypothetical protein NDA16_000086 [Ustilago loliicola]
MSIQQGLISPPLSGRTHKADPPRVGGIHKAINTVDVFGPTVHQAEPSNFEHNRHHHTITSPVKKHHDNLSEAERAVRPLTPPMSKDVRHDAQTRQREERASRHRTSSGADPFEVPASASSSATYPAASIEAPPASGLLEAAHIGNRFDTLNNGVDFASDDDYNPFLDRKRSTSSCSYSQVAKLARPGSASTHHSHTRYDEFDSDQDAEGSVHEDDRASDLRSDATPRASSSNATTPPARIGNVPTYRPARPFSTRVRVDNEPVTSSLPIRDTPKNPFLAGGPADNGFHGPNGHLAHRRAKQIPGKERGKIAYVFRGQKVTYADPEYDSDDDDDSEEDERARTNLFNPHYKQERPPRLQPKLLFPPSIPSSSYATGSNSSSKSARSHAPAAVANRRSNSSQSFLPRAELADDEFGGTGCSGRDQETRNGGGLFAAQIAAKQQQREATAATRIAPSYGPRSSSHDSARSQDGQQYSDEAPEAKHKYAAPSSSARLQNVLHHSHTGNEEIPATSNGRRTGDEERQTAREALLARLDQTNWSDDDEDDQDGDNSFNRRRARAGSEGTPDEEEYRVESRSLPCSQSQRKRLSDELQAGHAEKRDVAARPMKRSRASYAY